MRDLIPATVPGDDRMAGHAGHLRLQRIARLLDSKWHIPGTRIRFGADAVLSLIPGVGPIVPTAVSAYLIWEARRLGVPAGTLLRMAANVGLDAVISAVPVAGSIGDVFFRANLRNMELLRRHMEQQERSPGGR
ncbi:DUF4112 domain-containing protein [Roseomonas sp. WA12]